MTLIVSLSLLLLLAHLLGSIAERIGQPALLGHMLAGVAVGPACLNAIHGTPQLAALADLAVLFVVLTAGLEMRFQHVLEVFRGRGMIALGGGFLIPAICGFLFATAFGLTLVQAGVVALCISVTALPVALRILSGFGLLDTAIARIAIAGALLCDVIVLLSLSIIVELSAHATDVSVVRALGSALGRIALLLALLTLCHFLCQKFIAASTRRNSSTNTHAPLLVDGTLIFALLFVLALAAASDFLGLHFAIGAFLGALMITRDLISEARFTNLLRSCELVTAALFAPLFLSFQGLQFKAESLGQPAFVIGLIVVAVLSKFASGYLAGRLKSLSPHDSYGVAIIMNARGVMEMVIASIAFRAGLVDQSLFSTLLIVGVVTTLLTPFWLKRWMAEAVEGEVKVR